MNTQLFLCPYCTLDISLINSFTKKNINTQVLFHTNCNERNHTNFIKEKFKQFHLSKEHCDNHKENLAMYQCTTCQFNFCSICMKKHQIDEPTHLIIAIQTKLNKKCKEHNNKCVFYCKTCQKIICEKCLKGHNKHDVIDNIDEYYYNNDKERLNYYLVMKQKQVEAINKMITDLLNLKNLVQVEIEEITDKIDAGSIFKQYDNSYFIKDKKESDVTRNKSNTISQSQKFTKISNSVISKILSSKYYSSLKKVYSYKAQYNSIYFIKEIKNNKIVTISKDKSIAVYDYSINKHLGLISSDYPLGDFIPLSKDTKLAVISNEKDIGIFDLSTYTKKYILQEHTKYISSLVELVKFNYLLSGSYDCRICIWDYEYGINIKVINQPIFIEKIVKFIYHDQIAYYSKSEKENNIVIYNIESGNLTNKISFLIKDIEGGFINLNDEYLVMYDTNNNIVYINLKSGTNRIINGHTDKIIQMIKISHMIKTNFYLVATIAKDSMIKIFDIQKEQSLFSIMDMNGPKKIIELNNGYIFCASKNNMLSIFDQQKLIAYLKHEKNVTDMIELADGEIAIADDYGNVNLYN